MCECFEVYCLSVEVPHIEPLNHLVEELKGLSTLSTETGSDPSWSGFRASTPETVQSERVWFEATRGLGLKPARK